ncbi:hypothetical protein MAR_021248, partial [Mya arenaria]
YPNGPPHLWAEEVLLEGETVNITCTSSNARPPPLLRFIVEDTEIDTNTKVSTTLNDSTGLYTSVSTLHSFKRAYGNRNMSCQQLPEVNGLYHETMSNSPPLLIIHVQEQRKLSKLIIASCSLMFVDSACNIKWESTIEHFKYTSIANNTFKQATTSKISFNVIPEDYGKQIRCSTECQYVRNALVNATTVIFEKKPKVVVYSNLVLPVPPLTTITLTCVANAHPVGNITWTMVETSYLKSSQTKTCSNASTCTYEMTTSDAEQVYSCNAKNEHGSDEGSIVVVHEHNYKEEPRQSGRGSFLWILLSGIAVVTLGIIVLVLCVFLYEGVNIRQDGHHTYQDIAVPSSNRPHELDATLSPGIYDEIDENNSSSVQAGTNLTTSATENRQCLIESSNPYSNISQRIPTGTQMTEMTRYFSESNNRGGIKLRR